MTLAAHFARPSSLSLLNVGARRLYATGGGSSSLVIIEHDGKKVSAGSLSAVSAAQKLGGSVTAFVAGPSAPEVAKEVRKITGVNRVIVANNPAFEHALAETYAPAIVSLQNANKFSHVVALNSAFGKNLIPRVSALLDVATISDVIEIKDPETFVRPLYAGNALSTVTSSDKTKLLTVRQAAFSKAAVGSTEAPVEDFKGEAPKNEVSKFISAELTKSDRPELTSASKIVSGGRALKSGENFKLLYDLADKIGAAVGASRAAVDLGYVSNDLQIGQTGKVVAPDLYLAVGISGAIQHLAGMKDSKVIACINKDPEAPFFQVADYGLVADLFVAVPEMTKKL